MTSESEETMGFDLISRNRQLGDAGYMRANVFQMVFLRSAMLAAGVKESLVYKKFLGNDGWLVTDLQAKTIAMELRKWIKGRNLVLDFAEENEGARRVNDTVFGLIESVTRGGQKMAARKIRRAKSLTVRVDREMRVAIRRFADFCERSGGFWVD